MRGDIRHIALLGATLLGVACAGPTYDRERGSTPRATAPPSASAPTMRVPPPGSASADPAPSAAASTPTVAKPPAPSRPAVTFPPPSFTPPHDRTAKAGDGTWRSLPPPAGASPLAGSDAMLQATTVHPDPIKAFVEVAIVAMDPSRVSLELVAGTEEPANPDIPKERRTGLVAPEDLAGLLFATNGGYKARHGKHGMRVGADVFLPGKPESCTIAKLSDGQVVVGPWSRVAAQEASLEWARQGPACLLEGGALHPDLSSEYGRKKWGAAEDGKKDIRRSAYALGPGGVLYFAVGEWTTADVLAKALAAAGATDAVQMDINWSFTRFVFYGRDGAGQPVASSPLLEKLKFGAREYWQKSTERDFFYAHVTR